MGTASRWALLGLAIASLALALWFSRRGPDLHPDASFVEQDRMSRPAVASTEVNLAPPATVDVSVGSALNPERAPAKHEELARWAEVPGSVGEFAAGFYGDEWVEARPRLAERIDLSMQPDIPIPPWESVLGDLAQRMRITDAVFARWKLRYMPPDPVDLDYLRRKYTSDLELDAHALVHLESLLIDDRLLIVADLEQLRAACDAHLRRKFALRLFDFGPFSTLSAKHVPPRAFHADSTGIRGWSVSWGLAEDEDPEFPRLLRSLEAAGKRVAATIRGFLAESR